MSSSGKSILKRKGQAARASCPEKLDHLILRWIDGASHHTSDEVAEWLEAHPRLRVIHFPAYEPEENPKEATWKWLKEEVSHHCWHETMADLRKAIDDYYQTAKQHTVNFLAKFGYRWSGGRLYALSS